MSWRKKLVLRRCLLLVTSGWLVAAAGAEETAAGGDLARARVRAKVRDLEHPFDQPGKAASYYRMQRVAADGKTTPIFERYQAAYERMQDMPRYSSRSRRQLPSLRAAAADGARDKDGALSWEELGPGNVGGRVRALLVDPGEPSTMYAAGVSGGVWKTTDGGDSWSPLSDEWLNLTVSSMAMDPVDPAVIYAGTGEGYLREENPRTPYELRGAGVFKTTDGEAFVRLPATATADFQFVSDLEVSTVDPGRIYAATGTGVWRSADGGDTWQQILAPGSHGGCLDLVLRSDRPTDVLFAACGTRDQGTVFRNLAAESSDDWQAVLSESGMGRTSLALAPSDQDRVYALAASTDPGPGRHFEGGLHAFFRSDDGGAAGSWTAQVRNDDPVKLDTLLLSNPVIAHLGDCGFEGTERYSNIGDWANMVAVDPTDPDVVWAGGVDLFRSDDGGVGWGVVSYWWNSPPSAHSDQHRVVFHPDYDGTDNQTLFLAGDGGVWRTDNARAAQATGLGVCDPGAAEVLWSSLNHQLGITQFYHGAVPPDGRTYRGGTQDNGTVANDDIHGIDQWYKVFGGDGGYVAIDPRNSFSYYFETQGINLWKTSIGCVGPCSPFIRVVDGITDGPEDALFIVPYVMDPGDPARLWYGTRRLWHTDNHAALWTAASGVFQDQGFVSAVAVSPADPDHVLAGLSKGFIHRHRDARAATGDDVWAGARPQDGFVSWLAFDPHDSEVAYATYAGFGVQHVWKTADGGVSWASIDGSGEGRLPDIPMHSIVVDPENPLRLFLGGELGVFVTLDGGETWKVENTGFANAVTETLAYAPGRQGGTPWLFAFTHGRGAWRVPLDPDPPGIFELSAGSVRESDVQEVVRVRRTAGTRGAVSVDYATRAVSATAGEDYVDVSGTLSWDPGDSSDQTLAIPILDDDIIEPFEDFEVILSNPTGGAGLGDRPRTSITILDDDAPPPCAPGEETLCLFFRRFQVEVTWKDFAGVSGTAKLVDGASSSTSGLFWFFAPDNGELLVKMVDGCSSNGHYWVFLAAPTNVEYAVTVLDTEYGQEWTFTNPLGIASPAVIDVEAFDMCF